MMMKISRVTRALDSDIALCCSVRQYSLKIQASRAAREIVDSGCPDGSTANWKL